LVCFEAGAGRRHFRPQVHVGDLRWLISRHWDWDSRESPPCAFSLALTATGSWYGFWTAEGRMSRWSSIWVRAPHTFGREDRLRLASIAYQQSPRIIGKVNYEGQTRSIGWEECRGLKWLLFLPNTPCMGIFRFCLFSFRSIQGDG
jgi:hypothetical protein